MADGKGRAHLSAPQREDTSVQRFPNNSPLTMAAEGSDQQSRVDRTMISSPGLLQAKWLQIHRDELLVTIQGKVSDIVDHLASKRAMDPVRCAVYQEAVSEYTPPITKTRRLLDWLREQPRETFKHFQDVLRLSGHGELAIDEQEVRKIEELLGSMSLSER